MQSGYEIDQVFVRKRSGRYELLVISLDPSGAQRRETLFYDVPNKLTAVQRASRHMASRGDTERVDKVRLRVETRGSLHDDASLKRAFIETFKSVYDDLDDDIL
jgi:hypothetical protein